MSLFEVKHLVNELKIQQQNVNAILEILNALFTQKTLDDLLNFLVVKTTDIMDSDRASLFLLDEEKGIQYQNTLWYTRLQITKTKI